MKQQQPGRARRRARPAKPITIRKSLRLPIVVFAVFVLYIVGNIAISHYHPVETAPAVQVTMDDSITVTGYFIRQEQVVDVGNVSTAEYNYSNGDKVAMGSSLITIYKNEKSLERNQKLEDVKSQISQLEALQSNSYVTNTSQIDQKITAALNTIGDVVDNASFGQLSESMDQLRAYALKSGTMNGDISDIDTQLDQLYQEEEELEQQLEGKTSEITSEYSGYFSQTTDGFEDILTVDSLDSLTASSFQELTQKNQADTDSEHCKIISDYTWYYAIVLPADEADRFQEGQPVTLRFSQPSDHIAATVYAVRSEEDSDDVLVIFQSDDMNTDLVSMRKEVGDVVIASYSGLKVSKEAVHMKDDQMGVYILNNSVASFKVIDPLYEGSDYYIVKQNVIGDNSLVVNDDVIIHAKDIDDKKVVK